MADGLLSLSWNNHKATFCHILSTLREKERYTDVTLACDGKFYPVHKLVLSTCSEYFESMFEHTPCKHPIIVLKDIKSDEVESLLSYMYAGVVNVAQNDLSRLIKAAELLKVKGLAVPDEPPQELEAKKAHALPWNSRDDRSSPHPKRRRREEPEAPTVDPHISSSPPSSPRASPYHPANDFHQENTRTPSEAQISESRIDKTIDRPEQDTSRTEQKSETRSDQQPARQTSPIQVVLDDMLVKEEIVEPLEDHQDDILNSGLEYSSMAGDSRLENSTSEGGGQDHGQLLPNKFEHMGPQHLPEAVVEALAGPSGMQGWLGGGGGELGGGGGFPGVDGYSGEGRHQDLRQPLPGQQQQQQQHQSHQMVKLESGCQMSEPSGPPPPRRRPPSSDRMHKCPHCSYATIYITNYRNHLRTHTGEKPFSCNYCQYRTTTKKTLTEHIRTHTGEKPYTCSFCTYGATTKQGLNRHILIHTGEKPFACQYCPYRAREKSALRNHTLALHTLKN